MKTLDITVRIQYSASEQLGVDAWDLKDHLSDILYEAICDAESGKVLGKGYSVPEHITDNPYSATYAAESHIAEEETP